MSLVELLSKKTDKTLYTTPSHGQNKFIYPPLKEMYKIDISETEAYNPQAALEQAQFWAREVYNTRSTTFLTNGSTSGIIAATLACCNKDDKILIWKNY